MNKRILVFKESEKTDTPRRFSGSLLSEPTYKKQKITKWKFPKRIKQRKKKKRPNKPKQWKRPKYHVYIKSKAWFRKRRFWFEVHGEVCAACGTTKNIDLHHISYRNLGRENEDELVGLCRDHHNEYHELYGVKHDNFETHNYIIETRMCYEMDEIMKRF